jgi:hypothetical protein
MTTFLSRLASPAACLYSFLVVTQFANGLYFASGLERPPAFALLNSAALLWLFGWWAVRDSRGRGLPWIYDFGFFLTVAWPLVAPYYLLKTRGAKGLILIVAFVAAYVAAGVTGVLFWLVLAVATGHSVSG